MIANTTTSLAALAAGIALAAPAAAQTTWDMPVAYSETNFHTENAQQFAEDVAEATDGEIEIVVHANGSLFGGADIKRAVQTGQAPIGERLLSAHQNEDPLFGVDAIPFLVTSFEASERLWEAARPEIEALLDGQNLVLLYAVPWPPQGLYADREITSAADLEGIKFRSYNAATARMAELAGATPVQIEEAELSQALATGVAEAFISSGATGYDRQVWEQLDYFYTVDGWLPRNAVFVNKDTWEGLDTDTQEAIRQAAAEARTRGTEASREYTQFTLDGLEENGMTVVEPSEELAADLAAFGETMTEEWLEQAGDAGQTIIEAYRSDD